MCAVIAKLPRQKLPYKQKGKAWRKDNVDHGDNFSFYNNSNVRQSLRNRIINLNLYNGIVSTEDMLMTLNPQNIDADFIPKQIPHKPIMVPKVELLVGEELNRPFDWFFTVSNPDAISKKEEELSGMIKEKLIEIITSGLSEEEAQAEIEKYAKYLKYNFQDSRERMVNHLMRHYYEELNFAEKFSEGMKDAFINAEEIYQCDIVSGEPTFEKLNNLKVRTVRSGNSSNIDDSDLIIIEDHWSPGRIIDTFYDELKGSEIDEITNYSTSTGSSKYTTDDENHLLLRNESEILNNYIDLAGANGHEFSSDLTDSQGNIRVLRVYWRSQKKIFKVKFYDEYGEKDYKYVSEEYIPNEDLGEETETYWVNEWWEGTKIGKDIYIRMRPKPVQYNRVSNPSRCSSGIIGEVYNTNEGRAVSMVDKMKNYQYLYDVLWDRLNNAIAKNLGKILLLDISLIPTGWEPEKWIAQATKLGIGVVDGFKEGNSGASQGKLAGNMGGGQNTRAIDLETGNYIQQHQQLLEYVRNEMGVIAGISAQREGEVSNRETKGGIERSVTQSSHITEWWFMKHESVKKRCLAVFLETAKIALKDNKKKLQAITDDMSMSIIDIDGGYINEADYGLVVTSSANFKKIKDTLDGMVQAFLQNGGGMSTVIDIMSSQSLADIRKKIESAEEETYARNAKAEEDRNKAVMAQVQQEAADKLADRELRKYEIDTKASTELQGKIIESNDKQLAMNGADNSGPSDLDYQKHKDDLMIKIKNLSNQMEMHDDKMEREDEKIKVSKRKTATS